MYYGNGENSEFTYLICPKQLKQMSGKFLDVQTKMKHLSFVEACIPSHVTYRLIFSNSIGSECSGLNSQQIFSKTNGKDYDS